MEKAVPEVFGLVIVSKMKWSRVGTVVGAGVGVGVVVGTGVGVAVADGPGVGETAGLVFEPGVPVAVINVPSVVVTLIFNFAFAS